MLRIPLNLSSTLTISMSLISDNRSSQINDLLYIENSLSLMRKHLQRVDVTLQSYPDLRKQVVHLLSCALYDIDKAEQTVYKHNININLTYEEQD